MDFGDDDSENPAFQFYGNLESCRLRFPELAAENVLPLNLTTKAIDTTHLYEYYLKLMLFQDTRHYLNFQEKRTLQDACIWL